MTALMAICYIICVALSMVVFVYGLAATSRPGGYQPHGSPKSKIPPKGGSTIRRQK